MLQLREETKEEGAVETNVFSSFFSGETLYVDPKDQLLMFFFLQRDRRGFSY